MFQDMRTLKDYLAYARAYINPRINERAGMSSVCRFGFVECLLTFCHSVLPAGSRLPAVSCDWLACGT